jgi:hypothetical protein
VLVQPVLRPLVQAAPLAGQRQAVPPPHLNSAARLQRSPPVHLHWVLAVLPAVS